MNRVVVTVILVVLILGALLGYQASKTGLYSVLLPSELLAAVKEEKVNLQRLRVAGRVTDDEINYQVEPKFELRFTIQDPRRHDQIPSDVKIPVYYAGLKPDMFAPGRDVIIDGEFVDGTLQAKTLLTQCPSKYEAPQPE